MNSRSTNKDMGKQIDSKQMSRVRGKNKEIDYRQKTGGQSEG